MSPLLKNRVSGAWVTSDQPGYYRDSGLWVPFGPTGGGPESLFTSQLPAGTFEDGIPMSLGTRISFGVPGQITHVRWYCPASAPSGTAYAAVFGDDGTRLTAEPDVQFASLPAATWITVALASPVVLAAPGDRVIGIKTPNRYPAATGSTSPASPFPLTNGNLSTVSGAGRFTTFGSASSRVEFPESSFNNGCYFVDVIFVPD